MRTWAKATVIFCLAQASLAAAPGAAGAAPVQPTSPVVQGGTPDTSQAPPQQTRPSQAEVQDSPGRGVSQSPPEDNGELLNAGSTSLGNGDLRAPAEAVPASGGLLQHWLILSLLGGAIALAACGVVLGLALWRRMAAVRSSMSNSSLMRSASPLKSQHLDQQVALLLEHVVRMRDRIVQLEQEVQRLRSANAWPEERAAMSPAPQSPPRNVGFFDTGRIEDHRFSDPGIDRAAPVENRKIFVEPAPKPPARVFEDHGEAIAELSRYPETREMLDQYNVAASQGDRQAILEFERRYMPETVTAVGDGATLVRGGEDLLWFLPLGSSGFGLVVPGPGPIKNWHKVYRTMLGQQAKERFGALYEVTEGPELTVVSPAWAKGTEGTYERLRSGVLRGALPA